MASRKVFTPWAIESRNWERFWTFNAELGPLGQRPVDDHLVVGGRGTPFGQPVRGV